MIYKYYFQVLIFHFVLRCMWNSLEFTKNSSIPCMSREPKGSTPFCRILPIKSTDGSRYLSNRRKLGKDGLEDPFFISYCNYCGHNPCCLFFSFSLYLFRVVSLGQVRKIIDQRPKIKGATKPKTGGSKISVKANRIRIWTQYLSSYLSLHAFKLSALFIPC